QVGQQAVLRIPIVVLLEHLIDREVRRSATGILVGVQAQGAVGVETAPAEVGHLPGNGACALAALTRHASRAGVASRVLSLGNRVEQVLTALGGTARATPGVALHVRADARGVA